MEMDLEKIEKLIEMMRQFDLTELAVRDEGMEFKARRGERSFGPVVAVPASVSPAIAPQPQPQQAAAAGKEAAGPGNGTAEAGRQAPPEASDAGTVSAPAGMKQITSPIVGTFYRKPSPDSPPYVEVGDEVGPDTVVCIIEAMKVMNEIKAETSGTIRKILVEDATPVEYGQPLFLIEPR